MALKFFGTEIQSEPRAVAQGIREGIATHVSASDVSEKAIEAERVREPPARDLV